MPLDSDNDDDDGATAVDDQEELIQYSSIQGGN